MLICTTTGRVLSPGQRMRVLTSSGFTEGVLDGVTVAGDIRMRSAEAMNAVALNDVEAVWRLT